MTFASSYWQALAICIHCVWTLKIIFWMQRSWGRKKRTHWLNSQISFCRMLVPCTLQKGQGGDTSRKIGWRCAVRFPKALFITWPKPCLCEARWPYGWRTRLRSERSGFESWPGTLRCALGQYTLLSLCLSLPWCINGFWRILLLG